MSKAWIQGYTSRRSWAPDFINVVCYELHGCQEVHDMYIVLNDSRVCSYYTVYVHALTAKSKYIQDRV